MGGNQGLVSKLVLVVHGPHHHAGGLLLCPALETGQPSDRHGTGLPALFRALGQCLAGGEGTLVGLPIRLRQHGMGQQGDDGDHQLHHPGVSALAFGRFTHALAGGGHASIQSGGSPVSRSDSVGATPTHGNRLRAWPAPPTGFLVSVSIGCVWKQ